ncbi:DUF1552 domain-containing protein [Alienimonas chondri]|uniref:DUF1552 domain-containing protein n=1 Tax=Alienimonas chondri TaxID=2681879 RepID=A0ABX1VCC0_9PLAN|nr:DUF1552 domain-containing protein [Alienimonas chondri]NNJ25575.1 hypothetical protein [Alienimonas chondri]
MSALHRRTFLRGAGAALSLPLLGAMRPAFGRSAVEEQPKRTVFINGSLGFHGPHFFPTTEGPEHEATPYLKLIERHRGRYTLFSGLSHPEQSGNNGHASEMTWLTSAQRPGLAGFRNTISVDQVMAQRLGGTTRLPFLNLSNNGGSLSWTANGVNLPAERSPAKVFKQLFVDGSPEQVRDQVRDLGRGKSILDAVRSDARRLDRRLGPRDQAKLDEYFTAVRNLEVRIGQSEGWATRPKPQVDRTPMEDVADDKDITARQRLMYELISLAFETDSTRVATFSLGAMNAPPTNIPGVATDWHNLSHHGKDEAKIAELRLIEEAEIREFDAFLARLAGTSESGGSVLDGTAVLFGSNLGNASAHDWRNLPILVAGGGLKHTGYAAHDANDNTPLANLFVTLEQRMGIETDAFGSSVAAGVRGIDL